MNISYFNLFKKKLGLDLLEEVVFQHRDKSKFKYRLRDAYTYNVLQYIE